MTFENLTYPVATRSQIFVPAKHDSITARRPIALH